MFKNWFTRLVLAAMNGKLSPVLIAQAKELVAFANTDLVKALAGAASTLTGDEEFLQPLEQEAWEVVMANDCLLRELKE
jgi:hypothetical protein